MAHAHDPCYAYMNNGTKELIAAKTDGSRIRTEPRTTIPAGPLQCTHLMNISGGGHAAMCTVVGDLSHADFDETLDKQNPARILRGLCHGSNGRH